MLAQVNWLHVIVAMVAAFIVAFIWYLPPIFGLRWGNLVKSYAGLSDAQLSAQLPQKMLLWLIGFLVNALVLELLIRALNIGEAQDALLLGVLVWLGFGATFSSWPPIHANQPWGVWLINNGAFLIMQLVMSVILALWK
jgi:hypothetical protein